MALTQKPEFNKALAVKEARQAIGYAIDYDGIMNSMLGGAALRPAHYLPIGVSGSTEEIARQIGFRQDLAKAKELLAKAGFPNGFEFEIIYGNAAVQGVTYQDLGQKIQSDLARVGIKAKLRPMDQVNLRTEYTGRQGQGRVLTFWNPPAVENQLWAAAVVQRVAKRVHWDPPEDIVKLVSQAADRARSEEAGRAVGRVAEAGGRSGQPLRAVPADLPDRRAQHDQGVPAHRRRLDARSARREAGLSGVSRAARERGRTVATHCGARTRAVPAG